MKLYTEEQVIKAIDLAEYRIFDDIKIIDKLTPIELPSDEDIEKVANKTFEQNNNNGKILWKDGIKWMKEQILNQNK